tara:strand:- start:596 stop:766 length:171 start_codon:yes stop_codon:yes gene_type:complete
MNKEYYKEVNRWKLKTFFLNVLKGEGGRIISNEFQREELAELLTNKLLDKIKRETR